MEHYNNVINYLKSVAVILISVFVSLVFISVISVTTSNYSSIFYAGIIENNEEICSVCNAVSSPPDFTNLTKELSLGKNFLSSTSSSLPVDCNNPLYISSTSLPRGCLLLGGTSRESAKWLWCWKNNGLSLPIPCAGSCSLSNQIIKRTAEECISEWSRIDQQLECAILGVHNELSEEPGAVCRHHSQCLNMVIGEMGYSSSIVNRWIVLLPPLGHSWNEAETDPTTSSPRGGAYKLDAFNDIFFWCPRQ